MKMKWVCGLLLTATIALPAVAQVFPVYRERATSNALRTSWERSGPGLYQGGRLLATQWWSLSMGGGPLEPGLADTARQHSKPNFGCCPPEPKLLCLSLLEGPHSDAYPEVRNFRDGCPEGLP
jgi:hypothetical protein